MKKLFIFVLLAGFFNAFSQSLTVATGSSGLDLSINSVQSGKLYYILRKTIMPSYNAQLIKDNAVNGGSLENLKKGTVVIGSSVVNQQVIQSLTDLAANTGYYLYTSFEPDNAAPSNPREFQVVTSERLQKGSYTSAIPALNGKKLEYLIYKNESYLKDKSGRKYPVLFFFHGDGEKKTANNTIDLLKVSPGLTKLISGGRDVDFLVVSVQMPVSLTWITPGWLNELVEKIKSENRIDSDKIYVSGYSGGGGGMYHLVATQPAKVAAFVPVAAVNSFWNDKSMVYCNLKNIPMWGFHGQSDMTVTLNNLKEPIRQIGLCSPAASISPVTTIYTDQNGNHGAIPFAAYNTEALYEWLISKSKLSPANTAPVISNSATVSAVTGSSVTLTASATDPNGISHYEWLKISGPDLTSKSKNSAQLQLINLLPGTYKFKLLVTDALKATSFKNITLTVSGSSVQNQAPKVSAGSDKTIYLPLTGTTVNGSVTDADGFVKSYQWTLTDGPNIPVLGPTTGSSLQISGLITGKYTFRLTAYDNSGASSYDEMSLTVAPVITTMPTSTIPSVVNTADYGITFPSGSNINVWKDKAASVFYTSAIKIRVDAIDASKVKNVEYSLNGGVWKDEWADKDATTGKYNYNYTFYALSPGSYTVKVIVNEISGARIQKDVTFSIVSKPLAREGSSEEPDSQQIYQVYSLQGTLMSEGKGKLETNSLSSGIYLIKTENSTERIFIE